jgi:hypothetical protein
MFIKGYEESETLDGAAKSRALSKLLMRGC